MRYFSLLLLMLLGGCSTLQKRLALDYEVVTIKVIVVKDEAKRDALCRKYEEGGDWRWDDGSKINKNQRINGLFVAPDSWEGKPTIIIPADSPNTTSHEMEHLMDWLYDRKMHKGGNK